LRLLAKKALWHDRKCCLAQRNSIWWSLETEKRVQNCVDFFASINQSRVIENLPPIDSSGFVSKLASSVPRNSVFPIAGGCSAEARALDIKATSSQSSDASSPCQTDDNPLPRFMLHPHSSFRSAWDILALFLLLYCIFSIPFQMSFSSEIPALYVPPGTDEDLDASSAVDVGWLDYVDLAIDAIFMMDVLLNFRTAFLRPHSTRSSILETRGRVIAVRYLKTSFLPDVVSSLPYQWITPLVSEVAGFSKFPRLFKLVRLLRLIKFLRLTRMSRTAANFKASVGMSQAVYRGATFLLIFSLTLHVIACFLYFVGTLYYRDPGG
jgi:hypothetical protein